MQVAIDIRFVFEVSDAVDYNSAVKSAILASEEMNHSYFGEVPGVDWVRHYPVNISVENSLAE